MPLRTILLRVMLWSLGIAAVVGVLTVLVHGGGTAWRIVGTALATALASGLMLPVSTAVDRKETRSAGLAGMVAVVVEFLLAIVLIWEVLCRLWGVCWEEEVFGTMLIVGLAAIFLMGSLHLQNYRSAVLASRVGLVVTAVTSIAWLIEIWWRRFPTGITDVPQHAWADTGATTGVGGLLIVLCLIGHEINRRRMWRWAGVAASLAACAMWLVNIWIGTESALGTVVFTVLVGLAAFVAYANLALMTPLAPHQRWVRAGTIIATALAAIFIDLIAIDEVLCRIGDNREILARLAAASGIAAGCGTMALAVLARLSRGVDYEPLSPEPTKVTLICPQCRKKQLIPLGNSVCNSCALRISIRIEEPRCRECGYLLYGLPSDRCPECGTVLSADSATDPPTA